MSVNTPGFVETFAYRPLGLDDDAIRLVELQPGEIHDDVRLRLFNATISKAPDFTALSYVWGPEPNTKMITIDGFFKKIRANLWDCLRHLQSYQPQEKLTSIPSRYEKKESGLRRLFSRRTHNQGIREGESSRHRTGARRNGPLLLWIDQLCINQRDLHERNRQVELMATLYHAAANVFSWIPPTELDERRIGKQLLEIGLDIVRQNPCNMHDSPWPLSVVGDESIQEAREKRFILDHEEGLAKECFLVHNTDEHIREMDSVVNDILCSEYWSRLWIRQEVLANRDTSIVYGSFAISLRDFATFTCILKVPKIRWDRNFLRTYQPARELEGQEEWQSYYRSNLKESKATFNHNQNDARTVLEVLGFSRSSERPQDDIATAIERWGSGKCRNPRDKIYGLRSLMKQGNELQVHYGLPTQSVLRQALALHCNDEEGRKTVDSTLILVWRLLGHLEVHLEKFHTLAIEPDASIEATPMLSASLAKTKSSYLLELRIKTESNWRAEFVITHMAYWSSKFSGNEASILPRTEKPSFNDNDTVWYLDLGIGSFCLVFQDIESFSDGQRRPVNLKAWGRSQGSGSLYIMDRYHFFPAPACLTAFLMPHQRTVDYHEGQVELHCIEDEKILVRLDYDALWFIMNFVLFRSIIHDETARIYPSGAVLEG